MVQKEQHTSRPVWAEVSFSVKEHTKNRKKTKGNANRHYEKARDGKRKERQSNQENKERHWQTNGDIEAIE